MDEEQILTAIQQVTTQLKQEGITVRVLVLSNSYVDIRLVCLDPLKDVSNALMHAIEELAKS